MAQYTIGIDGGGSRSRLAAMDKCGTVIGTAHGGATNISAEGYESVALTIKDLLNELFTNYDLHIQDCVAICVGSAGISTGDNAKLTEQIFRDLGYSGKLKIMNDAELVLHSETDGEAGAIIISGTGSVGYSLDNDGNIFRVGGWGHIIDDDGSGYRIGMDAIKAALMDFDGRGKKTVLTEMVSVHFGDITLDKLTSYVYGNEFSKAEIAKVARLVRDAANAGDNVAISIEKNAAKDLLTIARALINRAGLSEHKIVLSGGILLRFQNVQNVFCEGLLKEFPRMKIVKIAEGAEVGAARIAWEMM